MALVLKLAAYKGHPAVHRYSLPRRSAAARPEAQLSAQQLALLWQLEDEVNRLVELATPDVMDGEQQRQLCRASRLFAALRRTMPPISDDLRAAARRWRTMSPVP